MGDFPYYDISIRIGGSELPFAAFCDTGCSVGAVLPSDYLFAIDQAWDDVEEFVLGDSGRVQAPVWDGEVELSGIGSDGVERSQRFSVRIAALGNEPLLGLEVIAQVEMVFAFGREIRVRFA